MTDNHLTLSLIVIIFGHTVVALTCDIDLHCEYGTNEQIIFQTEQPLVTVYF